MQEVSRPVSQDDESRHARASTVDADDSARFARLAQSWWDAEGAFKALHRLNPTRLRFIRDSLATHFGRDALGPRPFDGLRVLDVGCGGGLVSEPLTRLGARVLGIDADAESVRIAAAHAEAGGLDIEYRHAAAEDLMAAGEKFDAVVSLEVIEHVADLDGFLAALSALAAPGGAMVLATLNRTAKSFLLAIVGAEYVLGWVPRGTHRWEKFVRPSELVRSLRGHGAEIRELAGVTYDIRADDWRLGHDFAVNYMAYVVKRSG